MKTLIATMIACLAFGGLGAGTVHTQAKDGSWTRAEDRTVVEACEVHVRNDGIRIEIYDRDKRSEVIHFIQEGRIRHMYSANAGMAKLASYTYDGKGNRTTETCRGQDAARGREALLAMTGR